jgi:HK97 family phage prohead protease
MKWFSNIYISPIGFKAADESKRVAIVDFATNTPDRGKEIFHPEGIENVEEYKANPVVLLNHDWYGLPIGQATDLDITPEHLRAKVSFDDDERSVTVYNKLRSGSLRTGSIGYDPVLTEYDPKLDVYHLWKTKLYELSIVTIPMNPTALVQFVKHLGLTPRVKGVIPYQKHPLADVEAEWDAGAEVKKADVEDLKKMCAYFTGEGDKKSDYKLPHHKVEGYRTVWRGVAAAMAALLGARGGVDIPSADRRGVYEHLVRHYDEFDKEPPEFKAGFDFANPLIGLVNFKNDELFHHELSVIAERLQNFHGDVKTVESLVRHHVKEGRVLSARNRDLIMNAISALQALLEAADEGKADSPDALKALLQSQPGNLLAELLAIQSR